MTDGEKKLLGLIQRYAYNAQRLAETEERINSKTYKVTPSYSQSGGGGSGGNKSKVESFVEKTTKLKREAAEYRRKVLVAEAAMSAPDLSKIERQILDWVCSGRRLASCAEENGIYISHIYKLRDRALRKALRYVKTQFEGICG